MVRVAFCHICAAGVAIAMLSAGGDLLAQSPNAPDKPVPPASAAEGDAAKPPQRHPAEAELRRTSQDYLSALQRGDAKAIAEFWTPEGTLTDSQGNTQSVKQLLAGSGATEQTKAARSVASDVAVRFVADNVAIETGTFRSPVVDGEKPSSGRYTAIWVLRDGKWKLASVEESAVAPRSAPQNLESLSVLVGEWSAETNNIAIRVSAQWDANQKFLTRKFSMAAGKSSLCGTQTIGWDPLTREIRSWMFNDDGSYTEGVWSMEGDSWMVLSTRVLPDGRISEAVQVYRFPDKDTIVWKLMNGEIDGQPTEDTEVVLKRSALR